MILNTGENRGRIVLCSGGRSQWLLSTIQKFRSYFIICASVVRQQVAPVKQLTFLQPFEVTFRGPSFPTFFVALLPGDFFYTNSNSDEDQESAREGDGDDVPDARAAERANVSRANFISLLPSQLIVPKSAEKIGISLSSAVTLATIDLHRRPQESLCRDNN